MIHSHPMLLDNLGDSHDKKVIGFGGNFLFQKNLLFMEKRPISFNNRQNNFNYLYNYKKPLEYQRKLLFANVIGNNGAHNSPKHLPDYFSRFNNRHKSNKYRSHAYNNKFSGISICKSCIYNELSEIDASDSFDEFDLEPKEKSFKRKKIKSLLSDSSSFDSDNNFGNTFTRELVEIKKSHRVDNNNTISSHVKRNKSPKGKNKNRRKRKMKFNNNDIIHINKIKQKCQQIMNSLSDSSSNEGSLAGVVESRKLCDSQNIISEDDYLYKNRILPERTDLSTNRSNNNQKIPSVENDIKSEDENIFHVDILFKHNLDQKEIQFGNTFEIAERFVNKDNSELELPIKGHETYISENNINNSCNKNNEYIEENFSLDIPDNPSLFHRNQININLNKVLEESDKKSIAEDIECITQYTSSNGKDNTKSYDEVQKLIEEEEESLDRINKANCISNDDMMNINESFKVDNYNKEEGLSGINQEKSRVLMANGEGNYKNNQIENQEATENNIEFIVEIKKYINDEITNNIVYNESVNEIQDQQQIKGFSLENPQTNIPMLLDEDNKEGKIINIENKIVNKIQPIIDNKSEYKFNNSHAKLNYDYFMLEHEGMKEISQFSPDDIKMLLEDDSNDAVSGSFSMRNSDFLKQSLSSNSINIEIDLSQYSGEEDDPDLIKQFNKKVLSKSQII